MIQPDPGFSELIDRAARGDEAAVAELARQYEPKVRMVAHALLGRALRPYLDTMDLVQAVHQSLIVGLRAGKFEVTDPDRLAGLAVLIVRRKVARQWRRVQRQRRLSLSPADKPNDLSGILAGLANDHVTPASAVAHQDEVDRLWERLDAEDRQLVELRLQGYSSPEIAERLGISAVAARVRLTRLRFKLQAANVSCDWM